MSSSDTPFKVGIIGYGLSAKIFHIPFIAATPNLTLHSILQRSPPSDPSLSAPASHPSLTHHTELAPFLADAALSLVVLSTPPQTHFHFARAALEAGKHVLVEKPFVPTSAAAAELVSLAREMGLLLCVYQNRRWDADFLTVQSLLKEGKLGRIVEFETHYDRLRAAAPTTWKGKLGMSDGGGVVFDLGVHVLDQVYVLFGMPNTVSAKFVVQREGRFVKGDGEGDEPDSFTATLGYEDRGMLVVVRCGVLSVEKRQMRFWVRGDKGSYHKTGVDPQEDQLKAGMKIENATFGHESEEWDGSLHLVEADGVTVSEEKCPNVKPETYLRFYEKLAAAMASGKEEDLPVPASQAADVLRIIEAIKESVRSGAEIRPS